MNQLETELIDHLQEELGYCYGQLSQLFTHVYKVTTITFPRWGREKGLVGTIPCDGEDYTQAR